MELLAWFRSLFWRDPTELWPEHRKTAAVIDLQDGSLCGVPLGAPLERVREVFRKPSPRSYATRSAFRYEESGCLLEIDDDVVDYFCVVLQPGTLDDGLQGVELSLVGPGGPRIEVSHSTSVSALRPVLGPPRKVDADEAEIVEVYSFGRFDAEVEASPLGNVRRINVMSRADC